jgi:Fe-S-cluster-containing dehydrogenase component/formate-dependent nitrite reductase membrane component NrfD
MDGWKEGTRSVRYGFVMDNRTCIGCHACSVACKAENHVPLGVFRTWVKSVETGRYPSTRRYFQVTRCNHCDNPPCVAICPVGALYRRRDGIVDFDASRCIGCKACQQACPYDAIYTDPGTGTAAKCHYCAHRVDVGMEPACVVACPEHAILAGDLDDPESEVARALRYEPVRVRRPECHTRPKLFYVAAEEASIVPGRARNVGSYLFATVNTAMDGAGLHGAAPTVASTSPGAVVAYDVEHDRPWGWQVPAYFWTKSVSTGTLFVPALARLFQGAKLSGRLETVLSLAGLVFMGLTVALLISDLSRPERFLNVIRMPQARSWVSRGAFCLIAYGALSGCLLVSSLGGAGGLSSVLLWLAAVAGVPAAVYTAFLFRQCRGRNLWQTHLLPLHLLAQCVVASSAFLALVPGHLGVTPELRRAAVAGLAAGLLVHVLAALWEVVIPHGPVGARGAASLVTKGAFRITFWGGAGAVGCGVPAVLLGFSTTSPALVGLSGAAALVGLLAFEWCFVMAGQGVANS